MSFIIKTAKTVDEAIEKGLIELGLTRSEVEIEVLEEAKSGFLGLGQKDAMVKIKEKEDISSFVRDILYDGQKEEKKEEVLEEKEEIKVQPKEEVIVETTGKADLEDEVVEEEPVENEEVEIIETLQEEEPTENTFVEEEEEDFEEDDEDNDSEDRPYPYKKNIDDIWTDIEVKNKSEEFLQTIIDEFNISYDLDLDFDGDNLNVEIKSPNPSSLGIVIGKHGSTLDSLQYLLSQVINKHKENFIRVKVDANGYRDKRNKNLEKIAKRGLDRVIRYGRPVKLEPMNPADRRIVHMVLQNYEGITTHSEGRDPYRRVVISKKASI
ncbi:RNA-binding cell elongation regulator Jag/EloR [Neofamilia massiliensis]|uniref:RNA-binding cell elongation regulator Jag/EloR n=1 Tax=Neofamilia massiliensis TaxID=1673724 RepID=UPI0006BB88F8|nr:RNA-binding cell elongation regulator Jag/EloR [Neofamilia massiliensis]